jgi:hypothetical protein
MANTTKTAFDSADAIKARNDGKGTTETQNAFDSADTFKARANGNTSK